MARRGGSEDKEAHPLRWLDAARYAAASVVTVLILIVVVKASKVVLFPDSLKVAVVHGAVFFLTRAEQPPLADDGLVFEVFFLVVNPGKHAGMYYVNITTYLFDNDTPAASSNPAYDSIAYFIQQDIFLRPQDEVSVILRMSLDPQHTMEPKFFYLLYNNESASMIGVTMRMDATLLTEGLASGGGYNTSRQVSYYCWPLVILHKKFLDDSVAEAYHLWLGDDVFCRDVRGSRFI